MLTFVFFLGDEIRDLKEHLRRLQQQSDSRRRAAVMEMMRQRAAEVANNAGWAMCTCKYGVLWRDVLDRQTGAAAVVVFVNAKYIIGIRSFAGNRFAGLSVYLALHDCPKGMRFSHLMQLLLPSSARTNQVQRVIIRWGFLFSDSLIWSKLLVLCLMRHSPPLEGGGCTIVLISLRFLTNICGGRLVGV